MMFIILFGIVSLFSDMTHEGASSIRGAYLSLLGASAGTIGFISGLGDMLAKTDGDAFQVYRICFAVLAVPGAITIVLLLVTKHRFPNPEHFEPSPREYIPFKMKREFILYIAGISLFAFGFIDYSLIIMHVSNTYTSLASELAETSTLVNSGTLPLLF